MKVIVRDGSRSKNVLVSATLEVDVPKEEEELFTVGKLKEYIFQNSAIEKIQQRLFWSGTELKDESKKLIELQATQEAETKILVTLVVTNWTRVIKTYTNDDRPKVIELLPNKGSSHGGERVQISVQNAEIANTWIVKFGDVSVHGSLEKGGEYIQCMTPPHTPGPVVVEISHDGVHFSSDGVVFTFEGQGAPHREMIAVPAWNCTPSVLQESCHVNTPLPIHRDDRGLQ